jgi:hypothetical protein
MTGELGRSETERFVGSRARATRLPQVFCPDCRHRDQLAATRRVRTLDKSSVVGVLPDRKARTRRPPCIHHLGIGPRAGSQPLQEIQDETLEIVAHRFPRIIAGLTMMCSLSTRLSTQTRRPVNGGSRPTRVVARWEKVGRQIGWVEWWGPSTSDRWLELSSSSATPSSFAFAMRDARQLAWAAERWSAAR